jgi:hypothetical protein
MKITKSQLRKIIKEAIGEENALMKTINRWSEEGKEIPKELTVGRMDDELGFATGERVLEFLAAQLNVREEDAPDFLRWVADRLEGK